MTQGVNTGRGDYPLSGYPFLQAKSIGKNEGVQANPEDAFRLWRLLPAGMLRENRGNRCKTCLRRLGDGWGRQDNGLQLSCGRWIQPPFRETGLRRAARGKSAPPKIVRTKKPRGSWIALLSSRCTFRDESYA